jgi:carbamoyl-phosphate synthase small subunit
VFTSVAGEVVFSTATGYPENSHRPVLRRPDLWCSPLYVVATTVCPVRLYESISSTIESDKIHIAGLVVNYPSTATGTPPSLRRLLKEYNIPGICCGVDTRMLSPRSCAEKGAMLGKIVADRRAPASTNPTTQAQVSPPPDV